MQICGDGAGSVIAICINGLPSTCTPQLNVHRPWPVIPIINNSIIELLCLPWDGDRHRNRLLIGQLCLLFNVVILLRLQSPQSGDYLSISAEGCGLCLVQIGCGVDVVVGGENRLSWLRREGPITEVDITFRVNKASCSITEKYKRQNSCNFNIKILGTVFPSM